MALSFDSTSNSGYQAASANYSWTHTVGAGNNQILVVSIGLLSVTNSVTALTYNGVSLTKLRSDVSVSTTIRTEIWYLVAPTAGAHSVAVTLNTASVSGAAATSYNDVDQTNPVDAQNGGTGTTGAGGGSASISTTTVKAGAWLVDAATTPTTFTVGSGQTQRANINGAVGSMGQSDKGPISPAGATTMQWDNIAALTSWTMSTLSLKPMITPNVSDTTVSSESLSYYADSVDTNERLILLATNFINTSDSSATSEFLNISALWVIDTTTISENVSLLLSYSINNNDTTTNNEFINISALQVSDTITTSENIVLLIPVFFINIPDSTATSENINIQSDVGLNTFEAVTVSENTVLLIPLLLVSLSDGVTTAEGIQSQISQPLGTSDTIDTVESLSHYSDQTTANESIVLQLSYQINSNEITIVSENIQPLEGLPGDLIIRTGDVYNLSEFSKVKYGFRSIPVKTIKLSLVVQTAIFLKLIKLETD